MPNIKLVNIRFNLDSDARDIQIHDALFRYPDGERNKVIKDALYVYLIGNGATGQHMPSKAPGILAGKPDRRPVDGGKETLEQQDDEGGAGNRCPTTDTVQKAVSAGDSSAAVKNFPPPGPGTDRGGEEDNVIKGLRSMIQ